MVPVMPRKRVTGLVRRAWTTADRWSVLFTHDYLHAGLSREQQRRVWRDLGEVLTLEWVRRKPFTRPAGWWRFEQEVEPPAEKDAQKRFLIARPGLLTNEEKELLP